MNNFHSHKLLPKLKDVDLGFDYNYFYSKQKRVRFLKVRKEKKKL